MSPVRRIVPAVLTDNAADLARMVQQAEGFATWVQFDIMDGLFVPSQSVFCADVAAVKPCFEYDIHFMVRHPEHYFPSIQVAGVRRITFHYEAIPHAIDWVAHVKSMGLEAGLALNPETPVEVVTDELAEKTDAFLLLSVHPGYYGRPFIPEVLEKAKELRRAYPKLVIGLDGGIKSGNITDIARVGVDEICVGSAIFAAPDPAEAYRKLVGLAGLGWREYDENG